MLRALGLVAAVLAAAEAAGQDAEADGQERIVVGSGPERMPIYPIQSYSMAIEDDLTFFLQLDDPLAETEQYAAEACFITSDDRICTETTVYEAAMIPRFFARSTYNGEESVEVILYAPGCSTRIVLHDRSRVESTIGPGCR